VFFAFLSFLKNDTDVVAAFAALPRREENGLTVREYKNRGPSAEFCSRFLKSKASKSLPESEAKHESESRPEFIKVEVSVVPVKNLAPFFNETLLQYIALKPRSELGRAQAQARTAWLD
jgi:hypothetical protein